MRRLGQRRRIGDLARQGQRHRGGQVGVGDGADIGACRVDRQVDGQVRGGPEPRTRPRLARRVAQADDDQIVGSEFVLAPPRWRHEESRLVEPDREVALTRGDQASGAEPSSREDERLGRRLEVHPGIVRLAGRPRTISP